MIRTTFTSRRALLAGAVGGPLVMALGGCVGQSWDKLPGTSLSIATGNRGGVFDRYGNALAAVLEERLDGVSVTAHNTNASLINLSEVAQGTSDIGFALGDAAADAIRGTGPFADPIDLAALTRTYDSFVHLVVTADSPVQEVAHLRGRRVGLGNRGSGTRLVAGRILAAAGIASDEVTGTDDSLEQSADGLRRGRLDAFFFVSGIPNTAVAKLSESVPIRLVDLGTLLPELTEAYGPEYTLGPVPTSSYGLPRAVDAVSVKNYLVVHPDLDEELAYAVTRVMFEAQDRVDRISPQVRQPNLGAAIFTSPLPLHPGAERYYRERRQ
ncbi:TAXI family TRAP transporter solute-binding subunit [Nocardioides sp. NPDC059952]|uniref:TAXI family TRAP transporter solute-binding subunit n=1 Tax=Nocardioides sp. NPDC059952 TaxID=3347014 RepID=UPI003658AB8B